MGKILLSTTAAVAGMMIASSVYANQPRECQLMSVIRLPKTHSFMQQGLLHVRVVKQLEVGARAGDVVFQFPHGKIIAKPYYPPIYEGTVPKINQIAVTREAIHARNQCFGQHTWDREPRVAGDWTEGRIQPMSKARAK